MPNQALALSCASYAAYFGIPAENVVIRSPFLGGGFGSKAILNGPQILAILAARMLDRPVKLALTPIADVRPGRPSRPNLAEAAHRYGHCGPSDRASSSDALPPHRPSTISSSLPPTHRCRSMPARRSSPSMKAYGSTSARPGQCERPAKRPDRRPSKSRWTRRRRPAAWTRSRSGWRTMPKPSRGLADRFHPRHCVSATPKGPSVSAGPAVRLRRARCETKTACWSAGAWVRQCSIARISRRGSRHLACRRLGIGRDGGRRHGTRCMDRARPDRG